MPREQKVCQEYARLFSGPGFFCSKACFLKNQARLKKKANQ